MSAFRPGGFREIVGVFEMKNLFARSLTVGGSLGALFVASSAHAAMDTTAALATFSDVQTAVPVVGAAFLAVLGLMAAWKLIRGAFA